MKAMFFLILAFCWYGNICECQSDRQPYWKPLPKDVVEAGTQERLPKPMEGAEVSWAVVVGINDYKYNKGVPDLKCAVNDAHAFAKYILSIGIPEKHIYLLTNEDATKEKLSNVLNELKDLMSTKSMMYFYLAGHGKKHQGKGYFIMHDTLCTVEDLAETGYPMQELKKKLDGLMAKKLLIFLDTCYSAGARAASEIENMSPKSMEFVSRGAEQDYESRGALSQQDSVMLASSQANQESFERGGNGLFTSYLLEGLKGKADYDEDHLHVTMEEAYRYLVANVQKQLPYLDCSPNWDQDFGIPCKIIAPWTFQSLQIQDASRKICTEFELGENIYVNLTWSTKEIVAGSRDTISIRGEGINEISKVIGKSKVSSKSTYILPVELLEAKAGEYEIEVELKVGNLSQKKKATFTVNEPRVEAKDITISIQGQESIQEKKSVEYEIVVTNHNPKAEDEFKIEVQLKDMAYEGVENQVWSEQISLKPQQQWKKTCKLMGCKPGTGQIKVNMSFSTIEDILQSMTKDVQITAIPNPVIIATPPSTTRPASPETESKPDQSGYQYHIVKAGDSILRISKLYYQTSAYVAAIRKYNELGSDMLIIGQKLTIPPLEIIKQYHIGLSMPPKPPVPTQPIQPQPDQAAPTYLGFTYLRTATHSCGGVTNTVKEYRHDQTGMEFVLVPGGTFMMGSPSGEAGRGSNEVQHQVTLSPYLISKTEVTQAVWERVMSSSPSRFKGADRPVEQVSWEDCMGFCQKTGLTLPTEAQWEFACRAGTQSAYYFGNDPSSLDKYAWYRNDSGMQTHPVAQKQPNAYGLYDIAGNVWEWVSDWDGDYSSGNATDPVGPSNGSNRANRGGSGEYGASFCRSACRCAFSPGILYYYLGFRVCGAYPKSQVIDK